VKALSQQQAAEMLRGPTPALLLDVRSTEGSRAAAPVAPRRVAVPWLVPCLESSNADKLHHNADFVDEVLFNYSAGDEAVILIDAAGPQADAAAHELADSSSRARVYFVTGGLRAWAAAGLPVEGSAAAALSPPAQDVAGAGNALLEPAAAERSSGYAFKPKLLTVLAEGYGAADLRRDVLAGLSVGVIALSLSMALGIASESTPAAGLYTAVAAGFVISLLGGSRVAIGGPTAAFIPIVVGVAHDYGAEALVTCTAMSGMMLIAMGVARLGSVITAIPRPVVTGFTGGIAVFIFSTQIKDFLGLHLPAGSGPVPSQFLEKIVFLGSHLDSAHLPSLALSVASLGLLRLYPAAWAKVVPPQIVVVAVATAAVAGLDAGGLANGIETIGSRFGMDAIPSSLPAPSFTFPSAETVSNLVRPSFTIALLAAIESLLCAVVADGMIDDKCDCIAYRGSHTR
jgi:rhodanese-related sulfurtransferase